VHFAVRAGHADAAQLLLNASADPERNGYHEASLIVMARERGHEGVARLLEEARGRLGRVAPGEDHPIHQAAQAGDLTRVRQMLDADPSLLERGDSSGGLPLHRAVMGAARQVMALLSIAERISTPSTTPAAAAVAGGGPLACRPSNLAIWGGIAWRRRSVTSKPRGCDMAPVKHRYRVQPQASAGHRTWTAVHGRSHAGPFGREPPDIGLIYDCYHI
jgi:hypothetical protein